MNDVFISTKNERLDVFLAAKLKTDFSRSEIQHLIRTGNVKLNNVVIEKPSALVKAGDKITLHIYNNEILSKKNKDILPKEMKIDIVFENENLLVINKPFGLTVHPGAGNLNNTLVNGLLALERRGKISLSNERGLDRLGIVHRLDKDTSGLMIVAKHNKSHRLLADMIKQHNVERRYLALVHGIPVPPVGRIINYISRDRHCIQKMMICASDDKGAKIAITNYRVVKTFNDVGLALIECKLETGRTHQIRLHMHTLKHPIVGEQLYTTNNFRQIDVKNGYSHQMLHSYKLRFRDPINGDEISIERQPEWSILH